MNWNNNRLLEGFKSAVRKALYSKQPHFCEDIAVWAHCRGLQVKEIHSEVLSEVEQFAKNDKDTRKHFDLYKRDLERPQSLIKIEQAVIRDILGLVVLPDGRFCKQGNWDDSFLESNLICRRWLPYKRRYVSGDVYSLLSRWSGHYYHWFHDVLPRFSTAQRFLPHGTRFLIDINAREYQYESLKLFGISKSDLEFQSAQMDTVVKRLWFATPLGHASFSAGDVLMQMSRKFAAELGAKSTGMPLRRIFISRANATARRVSNENMLLPILKKFDFEIIKCEELGFLKQVKLFSQANVVVGPHGAGFSNMLFCKPKAVIGELYAENCNGCYYVMASQLGHTYERFYAVPDPERRASYDMVADVEGFEKWIVNLIDLHTVIRFSEVVNE